MSGAEQIEVRRVAHAVESMLRGVQVHVGGRREAHIMEIVLGAEYK